MIDDERIEHIKANYSQASLRQLWNYFLEFEGEEQINPIDYAKLKHVIRFGFDIHFDLYPFINNKINFRFDGNGRYVIYDQRKRLSADLYTEEEKRKQAIKKFLSVHTYIENNKRILE